jgi:hypothetical protein
MASPWSSGKSMIRTNIKMAIPIGGKTIADAVLPLGSTKIVDSMIGAYNPNAAYNQNMNMHEVGDRQSVRVRSIKKEEPLEDAVGDVVQGTVATVLGAYFGNAQVISLGIGKLSQGFSSSGRKTERSELENATQWASLMANNLDMFKKKENDVINENINVEDKIAPITTTEKYRREDFDYFNMEDMLKTMNAR